MTVVKKKSHNDGRKARSLKSREAIKKALGDLMSEGVRIPTAQQVSDRAKVGIRTVFRHFDDMESLFYSLHEDIKESEYGFLRQSIIEGPLEERVDAFLRARHVLYIKYREMILSTLSQLWKYQALKNTYEDLNSIFKQHLFLCLPELKGKDVPTQQFVEALVSFEAWNRLTRHQGMSRDDAKDLLQGQLESLLK
ncbi:TetR/AcrR family transcriptional regulator [Temperatibacter marinus]|uniref:TetR/AcrR family transcriptional regulator n=1 Tax=Temperatibacter marinus TaxID=1456591 RepID=A0AA52EIN0_9PROT|nr:TetR/AcrR family transcriptional regulator [Temperatibacter marinus]WND02999.1 TetR/AcrR family transcriptional regulator [Temperatibacter marinus]